MLLTAIASSETVDLGFVQLGYLKVIFLGIVQGITELLPISSTAHLRIVPSLLGWQDPGSVFSAAMQLASLGAVLAYFWQDIKSLVGSSIRAIAHQDYQSKSFRLTLGLLIGTIPIGIAGLLLKKTLNAPNSPLRSLIVIGCASIFMALLLAIAELRGKRERNFEKLTFLDGLWVGIAQAFALIPGVSRSGSTLTAGLFLNMERETAARFSFLLGLPAIILAGAVELHALSKAGLDLNGWLILGAGLTSASISAFLAIFGLLRYLEKRSTWFFVWYRLVMGLFLLIGSVMGFLR
ncbi:undecaprenyl-diphosphate phosphatase [Phormidium tenue]|jgi:undecaprenyl-diphosphatase|uniref:Undecaprenyl-diphosphatase n=1 Tax=Phormidium tenue FACHB-1050 TaxID=2692857 RepID=A0ABR8C802_9CYAN|nr:undecaprenyl-diphosphate phosphatase [Phormidium tenue]MBD2316387.1 undecaprenyl-diphosphate phosphatase [Phormidium tenue FACHB-1050]